MVEGPDEASIRGFCRELAAAARQDLPTRS
jgi:hypothetical protein